MQASLENESEILLGNKQLLMVFALVAVLLAIAFGAGYMLGKSSADKKISSAAESDLTSATPAAASGGPITQKITPDDSQAAKADTASTEVPVPSPAPADKPKAAPPVDTEEPILGARTPSNAPKPGENYVQVTAVTHIVANATADVLRLHGFSARVAPAPGNAGIFRVLVGPAKDPADLRNTEDKLRKIGYTKCFVQHY
jgi:cell division septation protein DedD